MTIEIRAGLGAALFAFATLSCGGGLPLLHPAQVLPSGATSLSAGLGSHWVGGQASRAVEEARAATAAGLPVAEVPTASALAAALWPPGLFPWVSMRLGLGGESEAGAAYTGRRARIDARHAFLHGQWALSLGVGAGVGLSHASSATSNGSSIFGASEPIAGIDTSGARAVAFDTPVIVGWRSSADIARIWLGLRPSYEHNYGYFTFNSQSGLSPSTRSDLSADVMTLGGLVGLAMGLRPLFIALELGFGESRAHGSMSGNPGGPAGGSASVAAFSFTPAAALIWEVR